MLRIGYCLSGGGIRGIGHLGVIKALEEAGIRPSYISGTSAGAIMGAFYAAGYEPEEILKIVIRHKFLSPTGLQFGKAGLFNMKAFEKTYLQYFPKNTFESLKIPLTVATTDIVMGRTHFFSRGNLSRALMASSCVPLVFEPVVYKKEVFLDGGILDNFPVEPLMNKCDRIIGVHVNAITRGTISVRMMNIMDRAFHLALSNSVYLKKEVCDLFIDPPDMIRFGMLERRNAPKIYQFTYEYAKAILSDQKIIDHLTRRNWLSWKMKRN